jgi:small ligand-binding sensory domain FIST
MAWSAAGSGLGVAGRPGDAAREAATRAMARSGLSRADTAVVFAAGQALADAPGVLAEVRRVTGARAVAGCGGAGVLTEHAEVEGRTGVAVLVVGGRGPGALRTALVEGHPRLDDRAADAAADLVGPVGEDGVVVVLPDARGLDPAALLRGLDDALGPRPVVGGVAAGEPLVVLHGAEAVEGGLAVLAWEGPAPLHGVAQGCEPIGEAFVVTDAEGPVVRTIAGRPALEVLAEAVRSVPDHERRLRQAGVFAGLAVDPAKSPLVRGDFLVRGLAGVDRGTGSVTLADEVRVGQTLQFQIRDAEAAGDDLDATLDRLEEALAGRRPSFGLYFNCAGRGEGLYGTPDHDVTRIRARLGEWPLCGFFGNGEFAPLGRRNRFHTFTGVLTLFVAEPAPAAPAPAAGPP